MFLTGDLKDGIIFDIINHVGRWYGRYPESFMKIQHDMAEENVVPSGVGWVFSKIKDRFKQIKKRIEHNDL